MTTMRRVGALALVAGAAVLGTGCAPRPPAIVPAEGTVFLDGKPLPLARIEFVPVLKDFGAEYNSTAVTDETGHFVLTCAINQQPGAAIATHRVVVTEYTPDDLRGMSAQSQARQAEYLARLKNRPIPEQYGVFSKTPLTVEVKPGQTTYDVRMTR